MAQRAISSEAVGPMAYQRCQQRAAESSAHGLRERSGRATRDAAGLAGPPSCGRCWQAAHAADAMSAAVGPATGPRIALEEYVA